MKTIKINGMNISSLTLGTVQLGVSYGIANKFGLPNREDSFSILQTALNNGINSFDTAQEYGQSEKNLGDFFQSKNKPIFITKITLEINSSTKQDDVDQQVYDKVKESLKRLQVDRLPILLLHNIDILENYSKVIKSAFQKMKNKKLVDKIGVSFDANIDDQFENIWHIVQHPIFEIVQIPINILDHRLLNNKGLKKLVEAKKIIFARSIFMQGLIFMEDNQLPSYLTDAIDSLDKLRKISIKYGISISQLALSFIRDIEGIHSLVIGTEKESQLQSTVKLMKGQKLSTELRNECLEKLSNVPENIINTRYWKN